MKKLCLLIGILFCTFMQYLFLALPALICSLFIKPFRHNLWLIYEDGKLARDNGYWFFKYVRENHPKQDVIYVIDKKSPDYQKVKALGKTCQFKSFNHWLWYFVCIKEISSHPHDKPTKFINKNLWRNKTFFLQHGVIRDYCFIAKDINLKLFVTSAYEEYEFIKNNFGFKDGVVQLLGLARHDNLLNNNVNKKQILIMPTWRNYLFKMSNKQFVDSEYFKKWMEVLNNKELLHFLEEKDLQIVFYPHKSMQKYINEFASINKRILIADINHYDVQTLLKESALLITDYSSVFFDFAYMKKPVIWYHFDEDNYFGTHHSKGYFKEEGSPLGEKVTTVDNLVNLVEEKYKENFMLDKTKIEGIEKFFKYFDGKNCERTYEAIKRIK